MRFIRELLKRQAIQQFIKYVLVGCVVTAIDMAALHLFYRVAGMPIKLSVVLGFMCGNISSFVFNKYFTFKNLSTEFIRQYAKYFLTSMTGLLWTLLLMTLFYEKLALFANLSRYDYLLCKMLVAVIVMFWNFLIIRHWTLASYEFDSLPPLSHYGKQNRVFLSVIIPAFNEQNRLPATITAVSQWLSRQSFSYEILVIDDGSTDRMLEVLKAQFAAEPSLKVYALPQNQGKGAAVRAGMLLAEGEYRLFMDADHQIRIDELDGFLPQIAPDRVLIGSKYAPAAAAVRGAKISLPRILVSRLGNLIIRVLLNLNVRDSQCGFKLFPAEIAEAVFRLQRLRGFAFDVEVLCLVRLYKAEVRENSIVLQPAEETRVRALRDSINVFADLLRVKLNIWRKVYHNDPLGSGAPREAVRKIM